MPFIHSNLLVYQAADRQNINKSWEHIQTKYVGTGHSDMTKYEWATNQHRDTAASHLGHYDLLSYMAVAQVGCGIRDSLYRNILAFQLDLTNVVIPE